MDAPTGPTDSAVADSDHGEWVDVAALRGEFFATTSPDTHPTSPPGAPWGVGAVPDHQVDPLFVVLVYLLGGLIALAVVAAVV